MEMVDMVITKIWFSGPKSRGVNIFVQQRGGYTAGIIIHMFEIKCNLILISNPIRAYLQFPCIRISPSRLLKKKQWGMEGNEIINGPINWPN